MLCDEIVRWGINGMPTANSIIPRIQAAHKFALSKDFAEVADDLTNNFNNIARALPFCRLPYAETWIELFQNDRPNYRKADMHAEGVQVHVRRVGFLCTATRPDLSAWKTHLFWECAETNLTERGLKPGEPGLNCAALATLVDLKETLDPRNINDVERLAVEQRKFALLTKVKTHPGFTASSAESVQEISHHLNICITDYDLPRPRELNPHETERYLALMMELAQSDWGGEAVFHLAVIGLLNSVNVTQRETVDKTEHNRKRAKRGQLPFFTHEVLRIHPRIARQASRAEAHDGDRSIRAHMCRGHWKVRKSGVFFWRPHMRGRSATGQIEKVYQVE